MSWLQADESLQSIVDAQALEIKQLKRELSVKEQELKVLLKSPVIKSSEKINLACLCAGGLTNPTKLRLLGGHDAIGDPHQE